MLLRQIFLVSPHVTFKQWARRMLVGNVITWSVPQTRCTPRRLYHQYLETTGLGYLPQGGSGRNDGWSWGGGGGEGDMDITSFLDKHIYVEKTHRRPQHAYLTTHWTTWWRVDSIWAGDWRSHSRHLEPLTARDTGLGARHYGEWMATMTRSSRESISLIHGKLMRLKRPSEEQNSVPVDLLWQLIQLY